MCWGCVPKRTLTLPEAPTVWLYQCGCAMLWLDKLLSTCDNAHKRRVLFGCESTQNADARLAGQPRPFPGHTAVHCDPHPDGLKRAIAAVRVFSACRELFIERSIHATCQHYPTVMGGEFKMLRKRKRKVKRKT